MRTASQTRLRDDIGLGRSRCRPGPCRPEPAGRFRRGDPSPILQRVDTGQNPPLDEAPRPLSQREREVLKCIADGDTTKEAARRLGCSVKTIETHRRNLMQKLGIDSVALLTKYAVREGITTLDS